MKISLVGVFILLLLLKVFGLVALDWLIVFLPLLVGVGVMAFGGVVLFMGFLAMLLAEWATRKKKDIRK